MQHALKRGKSVKQDRGRFSVFAQVLTMTDREPSPVFPVSQNLWSIACDNRDGTDRHTYFSQLRTRFFMLSVSSTPRAKPLRTSSSGTYSSYFSKTGTSLG